ncbi:hypothetical protein [Phycicoccus avicenniae]|uniref:phosphotransferase family protein n=1 Tax=Phycicoccus avicenniae TaxID=2828860 RepID=UPI003D289320
MVHGHVVTLAGRRVVTLLGSRRHHRELVRALDTSTPRRRLVRGALLAATTVRALPLIARRAEADEVVTTCLRAIEDGHGRVAAVMVAWPAGDRTHRRYLFVTAPDGRPLAFAKVSTRPDDDGAELRREAELLREVGRRTLGVVVPAVLALVDTPTMVAVVLEPIPTARAHLTWDEVLGLLPLDATSGPRSAESQDDVVDVEPPTTTGSASFRALMASGPAGGSGLAHGDLRPSNAVRAEGRVWLFDWEYGSLDAPAYVDLASAVLTQRVESDTVSTPQEVLDDVLAALAARGVPAAEAARAVGYLAGTGQPWAVKVVGERWPAP